jgi:hypothetical protein
MEDKLFEMLFNAKVLAETLHSGGIETVDLASAAMDAAMEAKLQAPLVEPFVEGVLGHKLDTADSAHSVFDTFFS